MVKLPSRIPVTRPVLLTVALLVFELAHVKVTPLITWLLASYAVAVSCIVDPSSTRGLLGVITILAMAGVGTVMVAVPAAVPERAVIVALPADTPVTTPDDETVATDVLLLDHVTGAPAMTLPFASRTVAERVTLVPMATVAVAGATVTLAAAGAVTVTTADADCPSLVAVIVADPGETPVTTPEADTVATDDAPVDHVMVRPVRTFPFTSFKVAVRVVV
jgi:hypothetical protein